ncbi:MAG: hypothetical protein WCH62_03120, partial [Candidatus Omnitrophota bacterium]
MDKKTISYLRNKFPRLFNWIVKSTLLSWIICELDRGRYLYCLITKKPYFGTVFLAGQTLQERKDWMKRLVRQEITKNHKLEFSIIEIGSWVGDSAVL